jgi:hypothetical protein
MMSLTGTASVVIGAGTNNIGAVSLAAGTAKIGFIGKISATTVVSGQVSVTGSVAISNPVTMMSLTGTASVVIGAGTNNIGAVSLAAGTAKIGFVGKISAGVVLAAGAAQIGTVNGSNVNISNTPTLVLGYVIEKTTGSLVQVGDSANAAIRVNVVAGAGAGANPVSIAAGTSNIGFINNISATVIVAGVVSLGAGTANIGFINNISATIAAVLAAGTANIGTINNISAAVVLAAGAANIGFINNISATVNTVIGAGTANIGAVSLAAGTAKIGFIGKISAGVVLAAGANNIGTIQAISAGITIAAGQTVGINSISATVNIAGIVRMSASTSAANKVKIMPWLDAYGRQVAVMNHPSLLPSASHGPQTKFVHTVSSVALVAAPGANLSVYVTGLLATNGHTALSMFRAYQAENTASCEVIAFLAANGGGFSRDFNPPWKLSANTALNACTIPAVSSSTCAVCVHFFVGPG